MVKKLGGPDDKYTAPGLSKIEYTKVLMVGGEALYPIGRVTTKCITTRLRRRSSSS